MKIISIPLHIIYYMFILNFFTHADPTVNIVPPVAVILPDDTELVLRCETNSPSLPVLWVADNLVRELSPMPTYRIPIPSSGLPDLTSFTCIVRNPENLNDLSPTNIVGRADAYVRNIPSKSLCSGGYVYHWEGKSYTLINLLLYYWIISLL